VFELLYLDLPYHYAIYVFSFYHSTFRVQGACAQHVDTAQQLTQIKYSATYPPIHLTFQILAVTLCTTRFNIHKFYVLPTPSVFMCFVWISEKTAIISLYNITLTGFYNRDEKRLLRGTDWVFK
jgi:hypothetical protein